VFALSPFQDEEIELLHFCMNTEFGAGYVSPMCASISEFFSACYIKVEVQISPQKKLNYKLNISAIYLNYKIAIFFS
jgi:hypothetical protein